MCSDLKIVLFVDHLCQILRLGKLFNQPSGFCSSGFTPVSYLHIICAKWGNLMEMAEKYLFHSTPQNQIKLKMCKENEAGFVTTCHFKCTFPSQILSVLLKRKISV